MTILRVILHVAIFAAAFLVFTLGLGVGLALNPAVGTLLWLFAGLIAVANAVWIVRVLRQRCVQRPQEGLGLAELSGTQHDHQAE